MGCKFDVRRDLCPICPELGPNSRIASGPVRKLEPSTDHVFRREASGDRRGTRSTGCPTAGRSRGASARRGPSAGAHQPATTRSARRRPGCARVLDEARRGTLPGLVQTERRSPTPRPNSCATSSTTGRSSPRRSPTTARSSRPTRASLRRDARRGGHAGDDRAMARHGVVRRRLAAVEPHEEQAPRAAARRVPPRAGGLRPAG
jgi:hypothetical protein